MPIFRERRSSWAGAAGYNPFENPAVPLSSVALDSAFDLLSTTDSGESVTVTNVIGLPIVWRCINLLATVVASCPVKVYKESDQSPVRIPVLDRYNSWVDPSGMTQYPLYTPYELWELVVSHLSLWGNAFIYKVRNEADSIIDLRPIYPDRVRVHLDNDTKQKIFEVKKVDKHGNIMPLDPDIFTTFEIMHIPGQGYDGLTGISPIQAAMNTLGTAKAGDKLAAKFLGNGSQLSGVIKVKAPLKNQAQAEGIRMRWLTKHGGAKNSGGVAVLDAETDFMPLTIPPDQLQFLESRRWQTTEIARLFGIPPHLVGDVEKSTSWGTGIEQQNIGFITYTIAGITNRIEQRLTREIVSTRGKYAEFDLNRLMRGDTTERFQAYMQAAGGPWMSRNEVRELENKVPLTGDPSYDELLPPPGSANLGEPAQQGGAQDGSQRGLPLWERRDAAAKAFAAESEDYDAKALAWMHDAKWMGPVDVPIEHIDPDMGRLDKADPNHVKHFVKMLKDGDKLKPVILVKLPHKARLVLVDGHHRFLASAEEGILVRAFVATVNEEHGDWDDMHKQQKHH